MTLELPGQAAALGAAKSSGDSTFFPTGPYFDERVEGITAEGAMTKQSWRINSGMMTTLQILQPMRAQLQAAGFELLYECEASECGGFDFRYRLDVLPEPEMHVSFGDYRYLAARRMTQETPEYVGLIVSRTDNFGFVQLTRVGASIEGSITTSTKAPPPTTVAAGPVGEQLEATGSASLSDLVFKRGKVELGDGDFASLEALASYLATRPDRTVVLVGHTDSEGSLDGNISLSRRRAQAVVNRLVDQFGVDPRQVSANGVGYLSPRASNLTEDGRALNRRVDVILSSTQ